MLQEVSWSHPEHGRITEHVCIRHELELLEAHRTLGMNSFGTAAHPAATCHRCAHPTQLPRTWIRGLAR